jgi:hypothetical protein
MIKQLDILGTVFTSLKVGNKAFLGGSFTKINGQTRSNFAIINIQTGDLDTTSPSFDKQINVIKQISSDILVIGGSFQSVNGSPNLFLTLYTISTNTFTPLITGSGYSILASTITSPAIRFIEYHSASNTVWAGGQFILSNGTTNIYHFLGVNISTLAITVYQLSPASSPTNTTSGMIWGMSMNPSTGILYMSVYTSPNYLKSFNVSNPSAITSYSWAPSATIFPHFVFYNNNRVYVAIDTGSGNTVNGLSLSNYGPLATNAVTGASITFPNFSVMKNQFIGDTRVNQMIFNNNRVYICGVFTDAKNISGVNKVPRHSFAAFDTSGNVVGDFISLSQWSTIYYIPPTPFQSFQPSSIYSMLVDDDRVHLFGNIKAIDGVSWTKGHYIVDTNGKKLQTKFIF